MQEQPANAQARQRTARQTNRRRQLGKLAPLINRQFDLKPCVHTAVLRSTPKILTQPAHYRIDNPTRRGAMRFPCGSWCRTQTTTTCSTPCVHEPTNSTSLVSRSTTQPASPKATPQKSSAATRSKILAAYPSDCSCNSLGLVLIVAEIQSPATRERIARLPKRRPSFGCNGHEHWRSLREHNSSQSTVAEFNQTTHTP